jgi:hypothetical protein
MEHLWYCTWGTTNTAVSVYVRKIFTTEDTGNHGECTEQRHIFPTPSLNRSQKRWHRVSPRRISVVLGVLGGKMLFCRNEFCGASGDTMFCKPANQTQRQQLNNYALRSRSV